MADDLFKLYIDGLAKMGQELDDLSRDTPQGPGWSQVMDPDRVPGKGLGWLGQFAGVRLDPLLSDTDQRETVKRTDGFKRGRISAAMERARPHLTGSQQILVKERDGSAWITTFQTFAAETPYPERVLAALKSQKPAGIILQYVVVTGQEYISVRTNYATYTAVKAAFATYDDLRTNNT